MSRKVHKNVCQFDEIVAINSDYQLKFLRCKAAQNVPNFLNPDDFFEAELDALTEGSFAKIIDLTVDLQNYSDGDHHSSAFCGGVEGTCAHA